MPRNLSIWVDAQLSPFIAKFIATEFEITASSAWALNLQSASDYDFFIKAKEANVIVLTKDSDFVELLYKFSAPPKIIWLTCGNTSNATLCSILKNSLNDAITVLTSSDLVEITN